MKQASLYVAANSDAKTPSIVATLAELALFFLLFWIVDAAVLTYIFPGYFDPFWPHHSDYYMPAAIAYSPAGFKGVLSYPRPVGQVFFWLIGHLKTRGAMVAVLCVVAMNYALIVAIMRRAFRARLDLKFVASAVLFAYLLAAHPYQYQFSTWDAFSQLSLQLLLLALALHMQGKPVWMSSVLVLLAFLSKETFIVSASLLAFVWWMSRGFRRASIWPLAVVVAGSVTAIIEEHIASSPFTGGGTQAGGPYQIVLTLPSVSHQWFQYAVEGMNWLSLSVVILMVVITGVIFGPRSREFLLSLALPVAGALAWLPNALLPNHHFAAYSWNGAYLIYAPVLLLALVVGRGLVGAAVAILVAATALYSPTLSNRAFAEQSWILSNQKRQKLFLQTFGGLIKQIPGSGQRILVSGIDFPYTMFFYKQSVRSLKMPQDTHFFVIEYEKQPVESITKRINASDDGVTMISPTEADQLTFDEAWLFRDDGSLIRRIENPSSWTKWSDDGITERDVLKYPELIDSFGPSRRDAANPPGGYDYLACGVHLIDYNNIAGAEACLKKAVILLPDNPYSFFWLGVALEKQGNTEEARSAYRNAVKLQKNSPNPAFQQALDKLH